MTATRPTTSDTSSRKARRNRMDVSIPGAAHQEPDRERRLVDIDPWAVLLEGLMEAPEKEPAERKGGKGK